MERYSEYKDSGVQWLGEIPNHWELLHLRNFLTLFSEKGFPDSQLLSVTRERGVILRDKDNKEENHNYVPEDLSGYKHLNVGDFVINKMKSWQGSYGVSDYEGIVSSAYFTCKLRGVLPSFFSIAIRSVAYIGFFMQYSKGIRVDQWDLDPSSMKDIPFVLPSTEEQSRIVNYLSTVTGKIDKAIAQQQKMIYLLNERKQIIINHAVTKGLNPDVSMKDSGMEWIGQIPEHWKVIKLKYIAKTNSGSTPSNIVGKGNAKSNIPWIRTTDLNNDIVNDSSEYLSYNEYKSASCPWLKKNTVLISMYGGTGSFGKLGILGIEATINQAICSIECKEIVVPKYLFYYLQSIHPIWMRFAASSRKDPNLNQEIIRNIQVVIPPTIEQDHIVHSIESKIIKINDAILDIYSLISLLQERKQIIINEVVIGKVKVS